MVLSLQMSRDALLSLFLFSLFFMTVFSTLLYFCERGLFNSENHSYSDNFFPSTPTSSKQILFPMTTGETTLGKPPIHIVNTKFESIPAAFWYVLVTITTVGFGDMVPQSFLGKLLSVPLMYFGILVRIK